MLDTYWFNALDELINLMDFSCNSSYCSFLDTPRKFARRLKEKAIEKGILEDDS